jgi:hypothetical protein
MLQAKYSEMAAIEDHENLEFDVPSEKRFTFDELSLFVGGGDAINIG